MIQDEFLQRKKDILSKEDKSSKGDWDKRIIELCDKINSSEKYYTTSSCSGRVIVMLDQEEKGPGLFEFISHDLIDLKTLQENLSLIKSDDLIKFKQEQCILHVACQTLEDATDLVVKAQLTGWKRSGMIAIGKRFMVELNTTERLEFPIMINNKCLVNEKFLSLVVEKANKNFIKMWEKTENLKKLI
ncbi:MAG TPA: tRNA wybutosine-synthesizing 3 family protein [Candidatus Nanoarchaeia archaeon]|nr:tRNA wybutosine-synthesizing 3 family protein [Candidatus Nanoarchaeia archaeon]